MSATASRAPRCMLVVTAADVAQQRDRLATALAAGVDCLQLRDRAAPSAALLAAAHEARVLTRDHGALLMINDRIDIALAAHADGVHLPAASFPIARARALVGTHGRIGRSTHAPDEARDAVRAGADYVVLGPIFSTPSKQAYGAPLGLPALAVGRDIPVVAIGGITPPCASAVIDAGASGVAVIRALLDAADPGAVARALRNAVDRVRHT